MRKLLDLPKLFAGLVKIDTLISLNPQPNPSKALNRIFLSFDNIDNKVKNLVKIDLSVKMR